MPIFLVNFLPGCPFMIRVHLNQQWPKCCPHAASDSQH